MAVHETRFDWADRGATSVYKFRFEKDDNVYVWFEFPGGDGSLYTTPDAGPYDVNDDLDVAEFKDLDELLAARDTTRETWISDLMAQFGERLAWTYP